MHIHAWSILRVQGKLYYTTLSRTDALLDVLDEYFTSGWSDTMGKIYIKINTVYSIHIATLKCKPSAGDMIIKKHDYKETRNIMQCI